MLHSSHSYLFGTYVVPWYDTPVWTVGIVHSVMIVILQYEQL